MNIEIKEVVKRKNFYHNLIVIAIFLMCAIFFVKINKLYLLSGADFGFHRLRLMGLVQSINSGDFFPKINYIMAKGLGYGVPMFYGQWFFYFPALLISLLGFTFTRAWLSLYVIYYITMLTLNYFIGRKFLMSVFRAAIFSFLLVFNPLITSIVNGDLPFAICLMVTPSLLYCLWRIMYFQENHFIFLALIITIVINTHILSTIVMAFICLLWMLLHLNKFTLNNLIILIKSILLSILLSASFWMPLLEQMTAQKLKGSGLSDAFRYTSVHGLEMIFLNSLNDSIGSITRFPTISLVGLILFFCILFVHHKSDEFSKKLLFLISFLVVFSSSIFPWIIFGHTPIGAVQFVGRYLIFALILILMVSAQNKNISNVVFVFCVFFTISSTISQQILPNVSNEEALNEYLNGNPKEKKAETYHTLNDIEKLLSGDKKVSGVAGGEYLNNSANLALDNNEIISNNLDIFNVEKKYGSISFDYELKNIAEPANIILPFLWYKGYVAEYSKNGKGAQPSLHYDADTKQVTDDGKVSIDVTKNGHVNVYYSKTIIQKISSIISFISWLGLIIFIFKKDIISFTKNLRYNNPKV